MHLTFILIGLVIACLGFGLPTPAASQFWKKSNSPVVQWKKETLAARDSGICYRTQIVDTVNPNSRNRQLSYCCDGYVNEGSSQILKCEPICHEDCSNGLCFRPGHCECAPGYVRINGRCHHDVDNY
ncbi:LOW QUALITY PROTEIN: protein draper [Drosophila eugracilis]|uniref:LOW QUALITY PROTEIN: protein draper n=1 Tax=Drosophila eugracilis TaxID=29029 RepID=UPI001BD9D5EA|nr:LOW QUALITY PROTEIN: protein draper [Drosophila eugracilis]